MCSHIQNFMNIKRIIKTSTIFPNKEHSILKRILLVHEIVHSRCFHMHSPNEHFSKALEDFHNEKNTSMKMERDVTEKQEMVFVMHQRKIETGIERIFLF